MNAEQFNARYPVGTLVFAYPGVRPEDGTGTRLVTRTRTDAQLSASGDPVVWVEGEGAYICLTHVDPVAEDVWEAARKAEKQTRREAAVKCSCLFGPRIVDGEETHSDDCRITNPVRHASWESILALVADLPRETGGTSRSIDEFAEDGLGGSVMRATYSVGQEDGSDKVYEITVSVEQSVDHNDKFWGPGGTRDGDDPAKRVVVDGEHYMLGDDSPTFPKAYKGFGGRRFTIKFFDGRTITTGDLWYQGVIPSKWRERYPDNARFVRPEGPEGGA
ncbi:hypothetical protein GCM10010348_77350 [Streptomyces anthocyanicus]|uniref:hypothetical protein n=1 Tax=Streptomyces anthocyanicus TaxID=68174 RepID=UPI0018769CCD|nr:hypothetical protein [Streptomyces anthocyanicus]GHC38526.1 hypothetical protein GCM10010348_77350 [Streptomyces anthocyanicus]